MVGTTTKPEGESSSVLPVAAVAVTLGTLGLLAWARSSKRGPWRSTARASSKPSPKWEGNVARGGEGEGCRACGTGGQDVSSSDHEGLLRRLPPTGEKTLLLGHV